MPAGWADASAALYDRLHAICGTLMSGKAVAAAELLTVGNIVASENGQPLLTCGSRYLGARVALVDICAAEGERPVLGNEEMRGQMMSVVWVGVGTVDAAGRGDVH